MSAGLNEGVWEKKELTEWFEIYFWMLWSNLKHYGLFVEPCTGKQGNL